MAKHVLQLKIVLTVFAFPLILSGLSPRAKASTAYGTLNNFDCVNDVVVNNNPQECHGFEIELEDIHSTDISYTYDYNHYGIPKITEDSFVDSNGVSHPRVCIRWAAKRNADGTWTAYTAIPSGPISPTDGHQFTNPSVNFGGEHFGVGYNKAPTNARNFWLIDDGSGNLVRGPLVQIAMPTFNYYPAVAQVQPVIEPPPPPEPPVVFRFGDASWVKDIKTTTHNANKVELNDLIDPDPDNPDAHDWTNGEPAEVETEWRLLQTEFAQPDNPDPANANGELAGQPEELPDGDEVITRRYEFYKYTGPIDAESGEAMASEVGPDGIHGVGTVTYNDHIDPMTGEWVEVTVDLSTIEVVGEFLGAQMSGFDVAPVLGLIDHLPDGEIGVPYADRSVVVPGGAAFLAMKTGMLPDGTSFDELTGVFSGTPLAAGAFTFTIEASDTTGAYVTKTYAVTIPESLPITSVITTSAFPVAGGTTTGDGEYANGTPLIVLAANNAGYAFVNWTEDGVEVSALPNYPFTVNANRNLVANFVQTFAVATGAAPGAGGTTSGDGVFNSGSTVMVQATPNPGYGFVNWTENGGEVSASADYSFMLTADRTLVANFNLVGCVADADCTDADACTTDVCVANVCENQPRPGCCNANAECDDGDACTRDVCTNHACTFEAIAACCNSDAQCADANGCTLDTCVNFECWHTPIPGCCQTDGECDDTDVCTADTCVNFVCVHQPVAECCHADIECDDGDPCTSNSCLNRHCAFELIPACCNTDAQCGDMDDCTTDTCVNHECRHDPVVDCCLADEDCDDGDFCTTDACLDGVCDNAPVAECCQVNSDCDDGIDCTWDRCFANVCRHVPRNWLCQDGKACNGREVCDPTVGCRPGTPITCDDGVDCTVDKCLEPWGLCLNKPFDSLCDDGLFCNGEERCNPVSGCRPANHRPCPPPFCDEANDRCRNQTRRLPYDKWDGD